MTPSYMERAEQELQEVGEREFRRRVGLREHWGPPHGPMQRAAEALVAELDREAGDRQHEEKVDVAREANDIAREARVTAWIAILVSVVLAALDLWAW